MTASKDDGKAKDQSAKEQPKDQAGGKGAAPVFDTAKPDTSSGSAPSPGSPAASQGKPEMKSAASASPAAKPATASPSATATGPSVSNSGEAGSSSSAKPDPSSAPLKPAATGSSALPPTTPSKEAGAPKPSEPAKAGAVGSGAIKPEPAAAGSTAGKSDTAKPEAGKTETKADPKLGSSPQSARVGSKDTVGDGPILDLKAKRLPDPAEAKASGTEGSRTDAIPAQEPRGAGFGSLAASGLIGGVIGAGLLFALGQSGVLAPDTSRLDALDQKIAALATRDTVGALDKRIAANEQALKPLADSVKTAGQRADEALKKAEAAPPAEAATGGQSAASNVPSDLAARLDALDQRVSALQEEPGRDQPADSTVSTPSVEAKEFDALRRDIDERAKTDQELSARLDQIQQSVDQRIKSATEAVQSATEASRQAAEAGKTQTEEAVKGVDRRLQEQAERLAALDKAVDGSAKSTTVEAALRIVAADRIATALAAGAPFSNALTSLRNTQAGDAGVLGPLEPFAETGAPTAASLAAAFRPIRDKVLAAQRAAKARKVAETGSITDRLQNMASSIIQVRRTDEAGASPDTDNSGADDDVAGKVQSALDRGQIGEAAQAFAALPEDVRAQAGEVGAKLKARAEADAAAQALQAEAFKSLSGGR